MVEIVSMIERIEISLHNGTTARFFGEMVSSIPSISAIPRPVSSDSFVIRITILIDGISPPWPLHEATWWNTRSAASERS